MVTSKRKFDFEGSYLKRLGESIALLLHIIPHKVKLDPTSIKNPMLRLDCAGTLPPHACCRMKILPHTAPYPFTLASLLGVSEHVDDHAVGVVL